MLKKFLGVFTTSAAATGSAAMSHHVFGDGVFSLNAPATFIRNLQSDRFQLIAPQEIAAITAAAYAKEDGSLEDFCTYRFSAVDDFYKQVSELRSIRATHVSGKLREFEGIWPGENSPTYFVVACLQTGNVYVSLNIVTNREHYEPNRALYDAIFESIRPGP